MSIEPILTVKNKRIIIIHPKESLRVDILEEFQDKAASYLGKLRECTAIKVPYLSDLSDVVLVDDSIAYFEKVGNTIVDKQGNIAGLLVNQTREVVSTIDNDDAADQLFDIVYEFKYTLRNIDNAPKDMKLEQVLGCTKTNPVVQTNLGLYVNYMLFDNSLKNLILSPFFKKLDFYLFPVFALGKEVEISEEEDALFNCNKVMFKEIHTLLQALEEKREVIVKVYNKAGVLINRELIYTRIRPSRVIHPTFLSSFGPTWVHYLIR